jgi:sugar lactone lactonase YvrE
VTISARARRAVTRDRRVCACALSVVLGAATMAGGCASGSSRGAESTPVASSDAPSALSDSARSAAAAGAATIDSAHSAAAMAIPDTARETHASAASANAPAHGAGQLRFEPVLTIGRDRSLGSAALSRPLGLSLDHRKRLYIADSGNDRIVILDPEGRFEAEFGRFGTEEGQFLGPFDVTAREGFFSYVVDSENERVQKFDRFRAFVDIMFARGGNGGAYGTPRGVEIDDEGRLYVTDVEQHKVWIIDSFRGALLLEIGGFGTEAGRFDEPADVAIGRDREIFVADAGNARVQVFSRLGGFIAEFDGSGAGGDVASGAGAAKFRRPVAVACDRRGLVYVADPGAGRVAVTDPRGRPLGELRAPDLTAPSGLAFDGVDILFVSDAESGAVRSFRVTVDEALGE